MGVPSNTTSHGTASIVFARSSIWVVLYPMAGRTGPSDGKVANVSRRLPEHPAPRQRHVTLELDRQACVDDARGRIERADCHAGGFDRGRWRRVFFDDHRDIGHPEIRFARMISVFVMMATAESNSNATLDSRNFAG